jgi:hypothetical protein
MQNNRNLLIGIVVVIIVLAGLGAWYANQNRYVGLPAVAPVGTTSIPVSTSTVPTPGPTKPGVVETIWRDFGNDAWKITMKFETDWKVNAISPDGKELTQVSLGGHSGNYFVSRNLPIAEPSKLTYTTTTRTIAGKTVSIHLYKNPNTSYAAYEYFSIPVEGDTYYFQLKETAYDSSEVKGFLGFIGVK